MDYFEKLLKESLNGDNDSLAELKYEAGAGNTKAQYNLALFYKETNWGVHDSDYLYWIEKYQESMKRDKILWDYCSSNPSFDIQDLLGYFSKAHKVYSVLSLLF